MDRFRREKAGRSATEKDRIDSAIADCWQFLFQITEESLCIVFLGDSVGDRVRIEIAIRAFLDAPGNVNVQP
jgi:hypothetical protein